MLFSGSARRRDKISLVVAEGIEPKHKAATYADKGVLENELKQVHWRQCSADAYIYFFPSIASLSHLNLIGRFLAMCTVPATLETIQSSFKVVMAP